MRRGKDLQGALRLRGHPSTWVDVQWQPNQSCLVLAFKVGSNRQSCAGRCVCIRGCRILL